MISENQRHNAIATTKNMHNRKLKEWRERQREKTSTVNCSRCEGQAKHFPWKIQIEQLLLLVVKRNGKYEFDNSTMCKLHGN